MSVVVPPVGAEIARPPSGRRTFGSRTRRIGLGAFFASVAVNAAIGIYALLAPNWGDTQTKILLTSLCVTGTVFLALACVPAWERGLLGPVPYAGAILGAAAFAMTIAAMWGDTDNATAGKALASMFAIAIACTVASLVVLERARKGITAWHERIITLTLGVIALATAVLVVLIWMPPSQDTAGKLVGTLAITLAACVFAAFLTLARLAPAHRRILTGALGLLALGVALVVANIWLPDAWVLTRTMGVVLIAFAAFAVSVPVLHWIDRGALAVAEASGDSLSYCPHCGGKLVGQIAMETHCDRCGREFTVTRVVPT